MRATLQDKAQLYSQLHLGLAAGVPLARLLSADSLPKPFAIHARRLARNVEEGRPLSIALRKAAIINPWEQQLLEIGEEGGRVPAVLRDLSDFFEARRRQLGMLKSKLAYPVLVLIVAILVRPLPELARGDLTTFDYLFGAGLKFLALYALYRFAIRRLFERAVGVAFNPLLLRILQHLRDEHWLRQHYEVAYLDLITLCLDCGLNAAEALRLLRDACNDPDYRQRHTFALQQVEIGGLSLAQALVGTGLLRNGTLQSFVIASEQSGTLHSDLRKYLVRKRLENAESFEHFIKRVAVWLYAGSMLLLLGTYL